MSRAGARAARRALLYTAPHDTAALYMARVEATRHQPLSQNILHLGRQLHTGQERYSLLKVLFQPPCLDSLIFLKMLTFGIFCEGII